MRVIGVIDLAGGRAVHARAGDRTEYRPVESHLLSTPGDALALALAYRERLGLEELYVADLDALTGGPPQSKPLRALSGVGVPLLVDVGAASPVDARWAIEGGATRAVVPLETLPSFDALHAVVAAIGRERVVFSLDLRDGIPIRSPTAAPAAPADRIATPLELVRMAVERGVAAIIVLDVARVGTGTGFDESLIRSIRSAHPELELLAGGGVRDLADLDRLRLCGCDGALVATALLAGRIGRDDVDAVRRADAPSHDQRSDSR